MKRLLVSIFSLALIFAFLPLHTFVQAEEIQTEKTNVEQATTLPAPVEQVPGNEDKNQNEVDTKIKDTQPSKEATPTTENKNENTNKHETQTPVSNAKLEIHRQFNDAGYAIKAKLTDVKSAEGTWTFYVDGKKKGTKQNKKVSATFQLSMDDDMMDDGATETHTVKIVFTGKTDGKDSKVEATHVLPDLKFDYTQIGNNDKFTGTLITAKNAVGQWGIAIADEGGEKLIDQKNVENYKGTTFSHTFSGIKKGTYLVYIAFEGKVDCEDTFLIKYLTLEVTEDGKGGDIKPPPTDYKPTKPVDKGAVDQVINNSKKGGPMPKTATSNPTGMLAGITLLVIGGILLAYRRFASQS